MYRQIVKNIFNIVSEWFSHIKAGHEHGLANRVLSCCHAMLHSAFYHKAPAIVPHVYFAQVLELCDIADSLLVEPVSSS